MIYLLYEFPVLSVLVITTKRSVVCNYDNMTLRMRGLAMITASKSDSCAVYITCEILCTTGIGVCEMLIPHTLEHVWVASNGSDSYLHNFCGP